MRQVKAKLVNCQINYTGIFLNNGHCPYFFRKIQSILEEVLNIKSPTAEMPKNNSLHLTN
jgi:hypothetical protein